MALHRPLVPDTAGAPKQITSPELIDAGVIQWNLPALSSDPSPTTCQLYWNITLSSVRVYNPVALTWGSVGSGGTSRAFALCVG